MSTTFHGLKVKKVTQETANTVTLTFDIPSNLKNEFAYQQGQYLTLKFELNGKEERRSYSMSSSPLEKDIAVTIKRVKGGLVSNHINDKIKVGHVIDVMPPDGRFYTKLKEENKKTYYLFGAGSGITPLMSILKTVAEQEPMSTIYLLYGNQNEASIIFKDALDQLQKRYAGQLSVEHILSQPRKEKSKGLTGFFKKGKISWQGKVGRVTGKVVTDFLKENPLRNKSAEYFICGPQGMIEGVEATLLGNDIDKKHIHAEYFVNANDVQKTEGVVGAKLVAHLDGKRVETTVAAGKTIIEALLDLKLDPPYSCTAGACATCMAKVIKGKVEMDACYALDEEEIEKGLVLTCQAHPKTAEVELTYDI